MVIKETILHSGWSYGNGDDQYDNESLGSTKTVVKTKKFVENSMSNKKNEYDEKMCSRQDDKHTNEQGWTTIDANKRKPKNKTSNNITLDSIISTIDIEFNIDTNGTLEATIDSPIRENRCVVPDKIIYEKNNIQETEEQEQGKLTMLVEEEEGRYERTSRTKKTERNKNKENTKREKQEKR
jgi:hypothetical protein